MADNVTAGKLLAPDPRVALPGFPALTVEAHRCYESTDIAIYYGGYAEDLLAVGIITQAHLQFDGTHRKATDGDPISVARAWRRKRATAKPSRYYRVILRRNAVAAALWPGVSEALAAWDRLDAYNRETYPARYKEAEPPTPVDEVMSLEKSLASALRYAADCRQKLERAREAAKAPRSHLRLVVDNTREAQS